jgi:hypothetical protein
MVAWQAKATDCRAGSSLAAAAAAAAAAAPPSPTFDTGGVRRDYRPAAAWPPGGGGGLRPEELSGHAPAAAAKKCADLLLRCGGPALSRALWRWSAAIVGPQAAELRRQVCKLKSDRAFDKAEANGLAKEILRARESVKTVDALHGQVVLLQSALAAAEAGAEQHRADAEGTAAECSRLSHALQESRAAVEWSGQMARSDARERACGVLLSAAATGVQLGMLALSSAVAQWRIHTGRLEAAESEANWQSNMLVLSSQRADVDDELSALRLQADERATASARATERATAAARALALGSAGRMAAHGRDVWCRRALAHWQLAMSRGDAAASEAGAERKEGISSR